MRQYIHTCLQAMTGHTGEFSPEMEAFWRNVQANYSHCNVPMMPQEHIPIWFARALDEGVPIAPKPKAVGKPPKLQEV
jgi:hypothetical protein